MYIIYIYVLYIILYIYNITLYLYIYINIKYITIIYIKFGQLYQGSSILEGITTKSILLKQGT